MRQETALISVRHDAMKGHCSTTAHPASAAFLGVEVVLARNTGNDLAVLCYPQTLSVRFVIFHKLKLFASARSEVQKQASGLLSPRLAMRNRALAQWGHYARNRGKRKLLFLRLLLRESAWGYPSEA